MNDKGMYHKKPIPQEFIANDEQRKQKADVEKRLAKLEEGDAAKNVPSDTTDGLD